MHVEIMDQQNVHKSARLFREMYFPSEKQVGKPHIMPDHHDVNGVIRTPSRMSIGSSPLEELLPNVALQNCLKLYPSHVTGAQREKLEFDGVTTANFSDPSWRYLNNHPKTWSTSFPHPAPNNVNGQRANSNRIHDCFHSSTSSYEIFAQKLKFPADDGLAHKCADSAASCHDVKAVLMSSTETDVESIENLLPNEEDLFSELATDLSSIANGCNDDEELDIFSSVGGLELEGDRHLLAGRGTADPTQGMFSDQGRLNGSRNPGSSNTSCFPLNGHCNFWSNVHSFQHAPSSPILWPSSLPFVDNISAHGTPKVPVLLGVVPHVMYTVSPTHMHQIGSAPSGSLYSEHGYVGESPKALEIHLNSLSVGGFPSSPLLRQTDIASHNIFSHVSANRVDMSVNSAVCSPQNTCHVVPGKEVATSMPTSFTSPRVRNKKSPHRRHDANSGHADQKKYELDLDRVLRGEDNRTTLMIKNIPNKYTSKTLLAAIDERNRGTYDFIYLPIDFKNKCNMGYAFINMVDPLQIIPFHKTFYGKKWEKYHSGKVASLAYARIQGKAALIAHFQDSSLMNEDKSCHPILFCTDGPNAGGQEPFPVGSGIRPRQHKTRYIVAEESQVQDSPSSSLKGEGFYVSSY